MTEQDWYIGDFLIEMFHSISEYVRIKGNIPKSIVVDSRHYNMIMNSGYAWVDVGTSSLMNGVIISEEKKYVGTFMRMRSDNILTDRGQKC